MYAVPRVRFQPGPFATCHSPRSTLAVPIKKQNMIITVYQSAFSRGSVQRSKAFRGPNTTFPIFLTISSPAAPPPITLAHYQSSSSHSPCIFQSLWCVCVVPGHAETQLIPLMLLKLPWGCGHYLRPLTCGELTLHQACGVAHP